MAWQGVNMAGCTLVLHVTCCLFPAACSGQPLCGAGETGEAAGQHLEQLAQHDMQQAEAAAAAEAKPGAGAEAAGGAGKGNESVPATAAAGSASGGVVEAALVHQLVEELQASPEGGKAAAAAGGGAGGGKAEEGGGEGQLSVSVAPAATGEWA